jgi:hypothetical protein
LTYSRAVAKPSSKPRGGRTTPKTPKASARYTPPTPRDSKVSPKWVPIVMFGALAIGMMIILANYVDLLPGDGPNNWYLLGGLAFITVGFVTSTKYH